MIGKALNKDNDIFVENGSIKTVSSGAEVVQHVRSRLRLFRGEYALDNEAGTPWFQDIFVKPAVQRKIESIIKQKILETPEVSKIVEFSIEEFNPDTRFLQINFSAETTYGEIIGETLNV